MRAFAASYVPLCMYTRRHGYIYDDMFLGGCSTVCVFRMYINNTHTSTDPYQIGSYALSF